MSDEKALNVSGDSIVHCYPFVLDFPDLGKLIVEEADHEKFDALEPNNQHGFRVLVQTFKELQELDDVMVNKVLKRNQIRYEKPGW